MGRRGLLVITQVLQQPDRLPQIAGRKPVLPAHPLAAKLAGLTSSNWFASAVHDEVLLEPSGDVHGRKRELTWQSSA